MHLPLPPREVSRIAWVVLAIAVWVAALVWAWKLVGWFGPIVYVAAVTGPTLFWPRPVPDDEGCLKCHHASVQHHGNCQQCLRLVRNGLPLITSVPCARFERWSPRTRWGELKTMPDMRARLRSIVG